LNHGDIQITIEKEHLIQKLATKKDLLGKPELMPDQDRLKREIAILEHQIEYFKD